jgi:acetylglutamate kinase
MGTRVVKVGGSEVEPGPNLETALDWVCQGLEGGSPTVLVHGGGREIDEVCHRLGLETPKVRGLRRTTADVLEVVTMVLSGQVNLRLVQGLCQRGLRAVGLSGASGPLMVCAPVGSVDGELGLVGEPVEVETRLVNWLWEGGYLPVLSPLSTTRGGQLLNVNADLFAGALARTLGAELYLITDVPGVLDAHGSPWSLLDTGRARDLLRERTVTAGMIPKLEAAVAAAESGSPAVWIGRLRRSGDRVEEDGTRIVPVRRGAPGQAPPWIPIRGPASRRRRPAPHEVPP